MAMIEKIEDYFARGCGRCARFDTPDCSTRFWEQGLADLRRICLASGLVETVKWGHPCYMAASRNVAIFGAFRDNYRLSFFNAGLMKDPDGIMERQGPNTQVPDMIRFTTNDGPRRIEETLRAYLAEAKGYAEAGLTAPKIERDIEIPEELIEALDTDPLLAEAFAALTPGRQKSYYFNLTQAKKPETRRARIEKFRPKIIAGKGAMER